MLWWHSMLQYWQLWLYLWAIWKAEGWQKRYRSHKLDKLPDRDSSQRLKEALNVRKVKLLLIWSHYLSYLYVYKSITSSAACRRLVVDKDLSNLSI